MKAMWAVVNQKSGKIVGVYETRDDARTMKAKKGGKESGVSIIKYIPVGEIR